jgi:hypothetical protein
MRIKRDLLQRGVIVSGVVGTSNASSNPPEVGACRLSGVGGGLWVAFTIWL